MNSISLGAPQVLPHLNNSSSRHSRSTSPVANETIGANDLFIRQEAPIEASKETPDSQDLIALDSKNLLPGYQQRPSFDPTRIQIDDLVLCHMTDYLDPAVKIPTNLETGHTIRPTVHFSLNHPVGEIEGQGTVWKTKKYCLLMPMKDGLALNGKPAGCLEVDTYWNKGVNYNTPQAILVVKDDSVPAGKAKVLSPVDYGLPKDAKILVLGTCEPAHDAAKKLIPKMGRTLLKPGTVTWGDYGNENNTVFYKDPENSEGKQRAGFKRFLREHKLKEMMHHLSPHCGHEGVLLRIQSLQIVNDDNWVYKDTDYKQVLLQKLQQLKLEFTPEEWRKLKGTGAIERLKTAEKPSDCIEPLKQLLNVEYLIAPHFLQSLKGQVDLLKMYPAQKELVFLKQDELFLQNLEKNEELLEQVNANKVNLLGDIPIYSNGPHIKEHDLTKMYRDRLFQQENQALLGLLSKMSKDGLSKEEASKQLLALREKYRRENDLADISPPSYRQMVLRRL